MNKLNIPFHTDYNYEMGELEAILEQTITYILNHARLSSFEPCSLCTIDIEPNTGCLTTELILHDSVNGYEHYLAQKDITKLNHHFRALKIQHKKEFQRLYEEAFETEQAYHAQIFYDGYSNINPNRKWYLFHDYRKKWQYLLFSTIQFETISRVNYDKHGRICLLRFKIIIDN